MVIISRETNQEKTSINANNSINTQAKRERGKGEIISYTVIYCNLLYSSTPYPGTVVSMALAKQ